jgi:ABC-type antimicrobial peptide transport system permease subunit
VGYDMRSAEMEADIALRAARGVPQSRPSPFIYGDPNATLVQQAEQRRLVSRLLLAISILTVLGSLTGYVAIAMAILSARKREIALRMAIGADARDIRTQILFESASAGLVAGLAGWLLGAGLSFTTAGVTGWTVVIEWTSAPTALGPALLVGLGIGIALAGRFAKLSPSLAARS